MKPIPYGLFLGDVVNFIIVALVLFLFIVKFLGWILRTKKEAPPPPLTKDQELLVEIRDLLKNPADVGVGIHSPPRHLVLLDDAVLADDGKAVGCAVASTATGRTFRPCRAANWIFRSSVL